MKLDPNLSIWLADSSPATPSRTVLGDILADSAKRWPEREALVYTCQPSIPETRWTYSELNRMAEHLAAALLDYGYTPGDRIAVWGPNHPEWILLEYALAKAGLIIVALNPLYKQAELRFALNASEVSGIFHADVVGDTPLRAVIEEVRREVPTLRAVHNFSTDLQGFLQAPKKALPDLQINPDSILMIQYTSGTTGLPKAAQLSHRAIATTAATSYQRWRITEGSKICNGFPLFHVGGSGNSIPGAALQGATALPLYIFKAGQTLDILEREQCTGFIGVPTMVTAMLEDPSCSSRDFSALQYIIVGGSSVSRHLLKRCKEVFGVEVLNCYGQTETCGVTSSTLFSDTVEAKTTTCGQPVEGVSVKIIDRNGNPVAKGSPGELCYRGPGAMLGYRDSVHNSDAYDREGWFKSGDMAVMNDEGFITIVGRAKEMIIRGGENLSPPEIENYLLEHPDVDDAAVIGLPDAKYGEEVCAVLRSQRSDHASPEQIRAWCAERISRWKVPRYVVFVESFPVTPSGKVKKFILREQMIEHFGLEIPKT